MRAHVDPHAVVSLESIQFPHFFSHCTDPHSNVIMQGIYAYVDKIPSTHCPHMTEIGMWVSVCQSTRLHSAERAG